MVLFPTTTELTDLPVLAGAAPATSGKAARGLLKKGTNFCAYWASQLLGPREKFAIGILMYHRVTENIPGVPRPTWNVTPAGFREQLTGLLRRGYEAWPLRRVLQYQDENRYIPRKTFVVTFDDCYENVYLNAWPIMRELKVPATLFLATAYLDSPKPFPSDDWSAAGKPGIPAEAWRPITTAQCREMQHSGLIELGAHTHTHADFRGQRERFAADLIRCQKELKHRFGIKQATFAFPYGTKALGFSGGELAEVAKEVGLLCSLTTEPELVAPGNDPFDWGRFNAEAEDTSAHLAAKINGWYCAIRKMGRLLLGRKQKASYLTPAQMEIAVKQLAESVPVYQEQARLGVSLAAEAEVLAKQKKPAADGGSA